MITSVFYDIERKISQLSRSEQLCLIERLAHQLRESIFEGQKNSEQQLAEMAVDPKIQIEVKKINVEFAYTQLDGLAKS